MIREEWQLRAPNGRTIVAIYSANDRATIARGHHAARGVALRLFKVTTTEEEIHD